MRSSKLIEQCIEHFKIANRKLEVAYHLLNQNKIYYNNPKVMAVVLDFLQKSVDEAISALVIYNNIKRFQGKSLLEEKNKYAIKDFNKKFILFTKLAREYYISEKFIEVISKIKYLYEKHKESPVELVKNDYLVICSNNYDLEKISFNEMADIINELKKFLFEVYTIIKTNSGVKTKMAKSFCMVC